MKVNWAQIERRLVKIDPSLQVLQNEEYDCGPTALYNALITLGLKRKVTRTRAEYATDVHEERGTDDASMLGALETFGVDHQATFTKSKKRVLQVMYAALETGPVIACVASWGHWVTVLGATPKQILVSDPEVGVEWCSTKTFTDWLKSRRGYYIISVGTK